MEHLSQNMPGLVATLQSKEQFGVFVSDVFCGHKMLGSYDRNSVFPIEDTWHGRPWINMNAFAQAASLDPAGSERDLFDYIYAVLHSPIRHHSEHQRMSLPARIGARHPKLVGIIEKMEENLEEPLSPSLLAKQAGLSTRQLERLFRRYVDRSPKRYYLELRLKKARSLLLQTDMSVINVALACGFASPSHFSKCYRSHYNTTPYRERGTQGMVPGTGQRLAV